jgi:hypothetical protein
MWRDMVKTVNAAMRAQRMWLADVCELDVPIDAQIVARRQNR